MIKITGTSDKSYKTLSLEATHDALMQAKIKPYTSLEKIIFESHNETLFNELFRDCRTLSSLYVKNVDASKVTDMKSMFFNCENLASLDLSSFDFSNVRSTSAMFFGCDKLVNLKFGKNLKASIDLADCNLSHESLLSVIDGLAKVEDKMPIILNKKNAAELTKIEIKKIEDKNWRICFYEASGILKKIELSKQIVTGKSINNEEFRLEYNNISNVKSILPNTIKEADFTQFDSSNVTEIESMLSRNNILEKIDLSNFNTSKATTMKEMFFSCLSLKTLDLSSFNTASIVNMNSMFFNCEKLASLDLSSFDFSNVNKVRFMFYGCESLTDLKFGKNLKVSIDLRDSPLTHESALSVIDCLTKIAYGKQDLWLSQKTYETLSKEDIKKATDKNWNIINTYTHE